MLLGDTQRYEDRTDAPEFLRALRDSAFDSNDETLALALGRTTEEVEGWTSGTRSIDAGALIKARSLAIKRGVEFDWQ